jgi:hypothetical protein
VNSRMAPKNLGQGAFGIGSGLFGFHFDICFLATLDMLVRVTTERWKDFSVLHKRERITPLLREETKVAGRQRIVTLFGDHELAQQRHQGRGHFAL